MSFERTLAYARSRDAADGLAPLRARFAHPLDDGGRPVVYLCGHSLGLQPLAARERIREELDDWAAMAVRGHESARRPWIPYHESLAAGLASLTGARPGEVVAMNSLTVNLHLMLASFYRPQGARTRILIEANAFPSDRHAVASQIGWHGLDPATQLTELAPVSGAAQITTEQIEYFLQQRGSEFALVLWPGTQYLSGQVFDLARIAAAARRAGCAVGFDLAHSIGNVAVQLHDSGADFAVWCSYKYLNAGPGAIGGCFVHERHARSDALPRLAGWWGHDPATRFAMGPAFRPANGADGWQVSNPPILSAAPLLASLELFGEAGFAHLRAKSVALTGFLGYLLAPLPVQVLTPEDPQARGCQLSLRMGRDAAHGRAVFGHLQRAGMICDWREPDVIRAAPVPLYNSFEDVFRFATALETALKAVA
ncbi:MAG TPA: kynureninase [Steroidobacteraceae bacterium]|nr:kynureninase [Steroidobacteraceae bacterium]